MTSYNLTAQLNHPEAGALYKSCFCYDDPQHQVTAEPLIHITTSAIQKLIAPAKPERIYLSFSDKHQTYWSGVVIKLEFVEGDVDGSTYTVTSITDSTCDLLSVWLCPRLLDYFPSPPNTFYCSISY